MSIRRRVLTTFVIVAVSMLLVPSAYAQSANPASSSEIALPVSVMETTATVFAEGAGALSRVVTGTIDFIFGIFGGDSGE